jgi:hypothetical protein
MTEEEMQQQKKGKRQKTFLMGEWAQVSDNILEQSLTHSRLEKSHLRRSLLHADAHNTFNRWNVFAFKAREHGGVGHRCKQNQS